MGKNKGKAGSRNSPTAAKAETNEKLQQFQNMSDDEFVAYLESLDDVTMPPDFYAGSNFQQLVYDLGVHGKPDVLSDDEFNAYVKANGLTDQVYVRGLESNKYMTAQQMQEQIMYSDGFHVGGGVYGDGLYYSQSLGTAAGYSENTQYGPGAVSKMVLKPTAKTITYSDLMKLYNKLPYNVQQALDKAGSKSSWGNSGESQLALKLGYDAITGSNWGHAIILNRKQMVTSSKVYSHDEIWNIKSTTTSELIK